MSKNLVLQFRWSSQVWVPDVKKRHTGLPSMSRRHGQSLSYLLLSYIQYSKNNPILFNSVHSVILTTNPPYTQPNYKRQQKRENGYPIIGLSVHLSFVVLLWYVGILDKFRIFHNRLDVLTGSSYRHPIPLSKTLTKIFRVTHIVRVGTEGVSTFDP